jgi:hypothetical protein
MQQHARYTPSPNVIEPITPIDINVPHQSKRGAVPSQVQPHCGPQATWTAIPTGAQQCLVTQHAMKLLTLQKQASFSMIHTSCVLMKQAKILLNFEHCANPMVHPVTSRTITSYKKLMHGPVTAEVWQTVFGKDFGGMTQGCNKTGLKGTNAMFVMTNDEIMHALAVEKKIT